MTAKLGRNAPCWCESNRKYKKCHLEEEKKSPVSAGQLDAHLQSLKRPASCFYGVLSGNTPCKEKPIASHTVPRSMLSRISLSGHVYGYKFSVQSFDKGDGTIEPTRIGIKQASTLPLFCGTHDGAVFAPLEDSTPFIGTEEQCALLAYRSLCLELFKKEQQITFHEDPKARLLIARGKDREQQQAVYAFFDTIIADAQVARHDIVASIRRLEKMLESQKYQDLCAYIVLFDEQPQILCAAATFPECDFNGHALQSLDTENQLDIVTFSLIPAATGGAFVLAWERNNATAVRLAESLDQLSDSALPHAILRFVFSSCENHYIQPTWWDALDATSKAGIRDRLHAASSAIDPKRLVDDGIRSIEWNVASRFWLPVETISRN